MIIVDLIGALLGLGMLFWFFCKVWDIQEDTRARRRNDMAERRRRLK